MTVRVRVRVRVKVRVRGKVRVRWAFEEYGEKVMVRDPRGAGGRSSGWASWAEGEGGRAVLGSCAGSGSWKAVNGA